MIYRSKAPLRLGLAGGGTDVSPYCDEFGGTILNVTINMYAYCTIVPRNDGKIILHASDREEHIEFNAATELPLEDGILLLHKGVYNCIVKKFLEGKPLSFEMTTYSDAPAGSGLGSSSTMVVAILKCFMEWLNLPLGQYDMAKLAYEIERNNLGLAGGKQDQYAATFGGFNYMEFFVNDKVIVNPLRIKNWIQCELENSLVLYYTGTSRDSATIINAQKKSIISGGKSLEGMHEMKKEAVDMKEALLRGDFEKFAECMNRGWEAKKKTSDVISNDEINEIYDFVMQNGGKATKISGAGGGGYLIIVCDPIKRYALLRALRKKSGQVMLVSFTENGGRAWTLYE
jgi:D-glycero-alpha-D-manno-heptose-7-phosphate kinase